MRLPHRPDAAWVETLPASICDTRTTDTPILVATCSCVISRRFRSSASRQPRASSSMAPTATSNAS
jgi:hypothetical protein